MSDKTSSTSPPSTSPPPRSVPGLAGLARLDVGSLLWPAMAGPLLLTLIFGLEIGLGVQLSMMGVHDEELQKTIFGRFGMVIARQQLEILGAYLALGLVLGLGAALVASLWDLVRMRKAHRWRRFFLVLLSVAAILCWRIAVTIVRYPQLYVEALYARGGVRRTLQTTLTDRVPLALLVDVGWLVLLAIVVAPMATARGRRLLGALWAWSQGPLAKRRRAATALGMAALLAVLIDLVCVPLFVHRSNRGPGGAGMASASAVPGGGGASSARPNFLVIAVDSLRADRVGPGHETVAPNLARLAERGVAFDAAHVTIPRTFPSWTTLLSGRYPAHHGLRHMFPPASTRSAVGPLLPSLLGARGYHTAVVSDFSGEIFSRLDAGFAERRVPFFDMQIVLGQAAWNLHPTLLPFVASRLGHRLFPALAAAPENADPERLADEIARTLERVDERTPFFVTAFFSTPHFPYAAPDPYYRRYTRSDYRGHFRYDKPVAAFAESDSGLSDEDVAQVRGLYDGAVASVDAAIGRVLRVLESRGLADNTIVVLLADHGEGLFEEGRGMGHGEHLGGDAMLHIPLVIYDPVHHFPPHHVPGIVRDVDLAPTLLALAGGSLEGGDGVDLAPLLRAEIPSLDLPAFAETGLWMVGDGAGFGPDERLPYPPIPALVNVAVDDDIVIAPQLRDLVVVAKHRALRTEKWKLMYLPTRAGVRLSLFDLVADPNEHVDVAMQHPEVLASLKAQLYAWMTLDGSTIEAGFVVPRR